MSRYIEKSAKDKYAAVAAVEKKEYYPLSSAQKRLYALQQMEPGSIVYNISRVMALDMEADREKPGETFKHLIHRHESLRTSFIVIDEEPVQRIHEGNYKLQITNHKQIQNHKLQITGIINGFIQPFDLSRAPLLRVGLVQLEKQKYLLLVDMHHIISDGVSQQVLLREFTALHAGAPLAPLKLQYKDYVGWQNRDIQKKALAKQEQYWLDRFPGGPPVLNLPYDYPRPAVQDFAGNRKTFFISKEESIALKALAAGEDASLYMVLLALFNLLLARLSGQEDIIVGTPAAGRRHADLKQIVGMFVNTLAMRNYPAGDKDFHTFLQEVKNNTLEAFENQGYHFEDLVEKVAVQRDAGRHPVFDVMFAWQNIAAQGDGNHGIAKFDVTLTAVETGGTVSFSLEYRTKLFKEQTIECFIHCFKNILAAIIENPRRKISHIEMIHEAEKRQILVDFNHTGREFPNDKTLHGLFEEQVEKTPDSTAVVCIETGGWEKSRFIVLASVSLTYKELNEEADQLTAYLFSQGAAQGHLVGITAERSVDMTIGILGILKAGCAYVPLDPKAPANRINHMLIECDIEILLTTRNLFEEDRKIFPEAFCSSRGTVPPKEEETRSSYPSRSCAAYHPGNLAYVIFTSGSTGKPKGVPISHANLSPLLHWGYKHLDIGPGDGTLQNLSHYFDWSVWEIFITLTTGACLYIVPDEITLNPGTCISFIIDNNITVFHATPSRYSHLLDVEKKRLSLRYLFLGAEKLTPGLAHRSLASVGGHCRVFNMYGPTETAIIASALEIHRKDIKTLANLSGVPIGRPAGNTLLLILDKYLNLCPVNITGELYIAGDGLSSGYLNNPELTGEKFFGGSRGAIFQKSPPGRRRHNIYKTGDLVRWLCDGNIEFLGRIDYQVKIRGYRIELGEIENALLAHDKIKAAVVLARRLKNGDHYLCAYIVAAGPTALELREYLSHSLPDYMIPSYFLELEKIPLTPNGKVDRKALPAPDVRTG